MKKWLLLIALISTTLLGGGAVAQTCNVCPCTCPSPTAAFQYGTVPTTGYKRSTIASADTYVFQPAITVGTRLSGSVTILVETTKNGYVYPTPAVPHRLVIDGVPQPNFTIDTNAWPNGTHVLSIQVIDPSGQDVSNGSKIVVFNNASNVAFTNMNGQAVVGGTIQGNRYNSLAWGRIDVRPVQTAALTHNPAMHPEAQTDAERTRLCCAFTERLWWVEQLTAPGTGLYLTTPILVKNLQGDYFIQQWYPATFNSSLPAVATVAKQPAFDGPRGITVLPGYTTMIRGLKTLGSGDSGWLGVTIDGRVVDLDITGEVTTIFGPRSVADVIQTDPLADFNLAQRLTAGEKEFIGDSSGGVLWAAQDIWNTEADPNTIWIADTGNNRIAILDRITKKIIVSIPLQNVSSVWGYNGTWWAVNPTGLYTVSQGQATLIATITDAFWVRGNQNGKIYVMTDALAFYEYDITAGVAMLRKTAISAKQAFAFFDIDVNGVIGPRERIYFGAVNLTLPGGGSNTSLGWLDPSGLWQAFTLNSSAGVINYKVYGSWMANSDPFGHYPWGFAIHRHIPKFIVAGIAGGWKVWSGHLGPLPNADAAISPSVNVVGTPLFREGRLDNYLGLGAVFGSLGHGYLGYHVDEWRDLLTWPESQVAMHMALDPLLPTGMTSAERDAVIQMMWAQRTRKHFQ